MENFSTLFDYTVLSTNSSIYVQVAGTEGSLALTVQAKNGGNIDDITLNWARCFQGGSQSSKGILGMTELKVIDASTVDHAQEGLISPSKQTSGVNGEKLFDLDLTSKLCYYVRLDLINATGSDIDTTISLVRQ